MVERTVTLNRDNKLEIVVKNKRGEIFEEKKGILYDDMTFEPLEDEDMTLLMTYKEKLRSRLVAYYNALLSGQEKLMIIRTEEKDCPYILSSETLLSEGWETPKYTQVFESVFLPVSLGKIRVKDGVSGLNEILSELSEATYRQEVTYITLYELMIGLKNEKAV